MTNIKPGLYQLCNGQMAIVKSVPDFPFDDKSVIVGEILTERGPFVQWTWGADGESFNGDPSFKILSAWDKIGEAEVASPSKQQIWPTDAMVAANCADRSAFHAWADRQGLNLFQDAGSMEFVSRETRFAWAGWVAARERYEGSAPRYDAEKANAEYQLRRAHRLIAHVQTLIRQFDQSQAKPQAKPKVPEMPL